MAIHHYQFDCQYCHAPTVLHAGTIWPRLESQDGQAIGSHSLALPCVGCKRIGIHSPDRNSHYHDPSFRVVFPHQVVTTEFLGLLKCDEAGCRFQVPLFSVLTAATTAAEREAEIASWSWDDLQCPAEHSIRPIPMT